MENPPIEAEAPAVMGSRIRRNDRLRKVWKRLSDEATRYFAMVLYLWVVFGVFALSGLVFAKQRGVSLSAQGFAIVNALILAKVTLLFEEMSFGRWLRRRPLVYPIVFQSLLLAALFVCFHVLEGVVEGPLKGHSVVESVPAIGGGGATGFAAVALLLFAALIPFFAFQNVSRAMGAGKLNAMLFGGAIKSLEPGGSSDGRS